MSKYENKRVKKKIMIIILWKNSGMQKQHNRHSTLYAGDKFICIYEYDGAIQTM
jgi:hypothetical protein